MQNGSEPVKPEYVALRGLVETAANLHNLEAKKITFSNNVREGAFAYADQNMLETIVRNLISNAVKFTQVHGSIAVDAVTNQDGTVRIIVADNGVGMDAEKAATLFSTDKKGTHLSENGTLGETGTGLGLLMVSEMVKANGGTIEVSSVLGKGTAFTVTLPTVRVEAEKQSVPACRQLDIPFQK